MTTVVISPSNVVGFPEGGGHFWVYMQYVQGLLEIGCEVYWLERFHTSNDHDRDSFALSNFFKRITQYGLENKAILYTLESSGEMPTTSVEYIGIPKSKAEEAFRRADFLLNFYYAIDPFILSRFRRTALVDIDPGLIQFWISHRQIIVDPHDLYLTIGETVGASTAKFPDCDLPWIRIRPPVSLEFWPYKFNPESKLFTTISSWWGGGGLDGEWVSDGKDIVFENNKRVTFLDFVELPRLTNQEIELALNLGEGEPKVESKKGGKEEVSPERQFTDYISDAEDRKILEEYGWQITHPYEVAGSPEMYQHYIQKSRGEYSCAKPSCMYFQNAWISDRTLCYLASGKPVIVQNTGPSSFLPNGEGMFRFSTLAEAVDAFESINKNYEKHCIAAREIAETYFDAKQNLEIILNHMTM
jgi:hypothetical protein